MADNIHKYQTKEVLNRVLTGASTNRLNTKQLTTAEILNLVLSTSETALNVNLSIEAGEYLYFGTQTVVGTWDNGTWRLGVSSGDFVLELKTSGSWIEKWSREA